MDASALATLALNLCPWADSNNVDSTSLYNYLNISYHEIENAIVQNIEEEYFYQELTGTLVANQWEYTNDVEIRGNTSGTNKVTKVEVDFDGTGNFIECEYTTADNIEQKRKAQSNLLPLYRIIDNSIEIYPTPTKAGTFRMRVVQNLVDLTNTTTSANIFNGKIHANNHVFIAYGAREYIFQHLWQQEMANNARNDFLVKLYGDWHHDIWLLGRLNNRTTWVMRSKEPNTSFFN